MKIGRVLLAVFTALLVSPAATRSAEPVTIRSGWLVVPASLAPLMTLAPAGVTRHLGISYIMEPIHFTGTAPQITALASGEIDISPLSFSAFGLAVTNARLADLRIIGDQVQDGTHGYHSNPYLVRADGPVHRIEDLKGKILATNGIGGAVDMALRAMLRKHRLEDKRDVTIIEVNLPNMKAMLSEGKVDLVTTLPPFEFDPELQKISRSLFTEADAIGPAQVIILTARAGFLAQHRAAVVDYLEDTLRLVRWFTDPANHEAAVGIVAGFMKQAPGQYDWVFTRRDNYRAPDGMPDLDALQSNLDTQRELGFLKDAVAVRKYAALDLVAEAAQRLGGNGPDKPK